MPGISEKTIHPTANHLLLYKEGAFWAAYEQSAFYIAQHKGYKPTKKYIKIIGKWVVSLGFPNAETLIAELTQAKRIDTCNKQGNVIEIVLNESIDRTDFERWKSEVEDKSEKQPTLQAPDIESRIRAFPLAHKTPMEAFMFLKELQEKITVF